MHMPIRECEYFTLISVWSHAWISLLTEFNCSQIPGPARPLAHELIILHEIVTTYQTIQQPPATHAHTLYTCVYVCACVLSLETFSKLVNHDHFNHIHTHTHDTPPPHLISCQPGCHHIVLHSEHTQYATTPQISILIPYLRLVLN